MLQQNIGYRSNDPSAHVTHVECLKNCEMFLLVMLTRVKYPTGYVSHVESRELFEFGEEMKFVVVLEAIFNAKLTVSSYMYLSWSYYIVKLRDFILYCLILSVY